MKYLRKLIIGTLIPVILLTQLLASPVSYAQTGDVSGNGGSLVCRNGGRDYVDFLSAVIDYNDFLEYWKDILVRYNANMCLYLDIDTLLQQIEKVRAQIRNAFYTCDASTPKLVSTYHNLAAELYFLRKYVQVGNGNILITATNSLSSDFLNNFVTQKGWYTQDDGNTLLQNLISKYQGRQQNYTSCTDPTWGNLIAKWNEFKQMFTSGFGIQQAIETINTQAKSIGSFGDIFSLDHLKGLLDFKVNGLDPATAWGDIAATLKKNAPTTGAVSNPSQNVAQQGTYGFTLNQFQNATASDAAYHDNELERTQDLGQYQELYQNGTSAVSNEIVSKIDGLITIIKNSYDFISQTTTCAKGIINKTCSG